MSAIFNAPESLLMSLFIPPRRDDTLVIAGQSVAALSRLRSFFSGNADRFTEPACRGEQDAKRFL
jgi:hypothetical protein